MTPGPPEIFDRPPAAAAAGNAAAARLASHIEKNARLGAEWLEAHPWLILTVFSLLYFAGEGSYASAAVLSHDEIWTLLVTKLPGWSGIWKGLAGGADFHPPLHYMLAQSGRSLFGGSLFGFRLASVLAFWLFSLCIFCFVKNRAGTVFGAIAMLVPFAAATQQSPYQARGYALMLGFSALSLLCWQQATTHRWRPLSLAGMGTGIFLGIASHYYGVLVVPCLAMAETVRTRERKHFDKSVWLAMAGGLSSLVLLWPLIQSARSEAERFWATPTTTGLLTVYQHLLAEVIAPAICAFLIFFLLDSILRNRGTARPIARGNPIPASEHTLALALSLLPFLAFALAKTVTNAFASQYVLPTVAGLAICFAFQASERAARREVLGMVVLSCFFGWFLIQQRYLFLRGRELAERPSLAFPSEVNFDAIDAGEKLPIVAPNRVEYLQFVYYWPAAYTNRLYLLVPDSGPTTHLSSLARWSDLQVVKYGEFVEAHKRFVIYGMGGQYGDWILRRLVNEGAMIELKGSWANQPVFVVTLGGS